MFEVEFYRLPNGNIPVKEFIAGLDIKMQTKHLPV